MAECDSGGVYEDIVFPGGVRVYPEDWQGPPLSVCPPQRALHNQVRWLPCFSVFSHITSVLSALLSLILYMKCEIFYAVLLHLEDFFNFSRDADHKTWVSLYDGNQFYTGVYNAEVCPDTIHIMIRHIKTLLPY